MNLKDIFKIFKKDMLGIFIGKALSQLFLTMKK